uniref:Polyprenol-phosphate-mannose--protein mannosyltransferase n=1 Tax=Cyanothece sp. (strain PCC 7425 / ATCC 29141) TaxID=395961 RepID=B8HTG7_CYAP4
MSVTHQKIALPWFRLGLLCIWFLSLGLRVWGLNRFNTLVFDEIYFARFGNNYLNHTPFFDAHPPLGKYLIAVSIALGGFNPTGYRWMNALVGSLLPLLVAWLAYQLTQRRSYGLIAGFLAAMDGLLLVESRYALINVYLLGFGLLGQVLILAALKRRGIGRILGMGLAGIAFGCCIAVKWNGLGLLLGLYLTWMVAKLLPLGQLKQSLVDRPWLRIRQWHLLELGVLIPAIAALTYGLLWIPHLQQNPGSDLLSLQRQILDYHKGIAHQAHTYCSPWYSWPLMLRPVSYFYQRAIELSEPMPVIGPSLPQTATRWIYDVHAMGNPLLWWFSSLAMVLLVVLLVQRCYRIFRSPQANLALLQAEGVWIPLYLVCNYAANLLPWAGVSRCLFIYHYMPASLFSFLGLAWLLEGGLKSGKQGERIVSITLLCLVAIALVYWLPIFLGLPFPQSEFRRFFWFPSWI